MKRVRWHSHIVVWKKYYTLFVGLVVALILPADPWGVQDYVSKGTHFHHLTTTNLYGRFDITLNVGLVNAKADESGGVDFETLITLQDHSKEIMPDSKQVMYCFDDEMTSVTKVNGGRDVLFFHDTKKLFDGFCMSKKLRIFYAKRDGTFQTTEFSLTGFCHQITSYTNSVRMSEKKLRASHHSPQDFDCQAGEISPGVAKGDINHYKEIMASFVASNVTLWLDSPLYKKIARLKEGNCCVVTTETWARDRSVLAYNCTDKHCELISCKGLVSEVSVDDFRHYCASPSLVAFCGKTYLNIPKARALNNQKCCIGELLAGDLFDATATIVGRVPSRKVHVLFSNLDSFEVSLGHHVLAYYVHDDTIREAIRKKLSAKIMTAWKDKHRALVARLPRKPPVVYGRSKTIVKRMDGTFEIPLEKPPETKTFTWYETIYDDAWGETEYGERVHMVVPVGQQLCSRTKNLTRMYDYDALKSQMDSYYELLDEIQNDKPDVVDENDVDMIMNGGVLLFKKL